MIKKIRSWLFENRHAKQTIVKNTFWLSVATFGSRFIKAFLIIYAARVLGTRDYGVFSYALSLAALFSIFADLGINGILTREASKNPEHLEKYISASFIIKLVFIFISVLAVLFIAPLFSAVRAANILLPLAALLTIFDALREFGFGLTRAKEKMEVEAGISLVTGIGIAALGFVAIFIKPTAFSLMVAYVAGSGLGFFLAFLFLKKYLKNFWRLFDFALAKKIMGDSLPFAIMILLGALTVNTDNIMIGWLRGVNDVGLYSAPLRIVLLLYWIAPLLSTSIFPIISRLAHNDDVRVSRILEKAVPTSLLMALPLFVGGAILSSPIISLVFGQQYISTAATFGVLLFTVLLMFPASIITNTIFSYNEQKILVVCMLIGGITNVVFDYLLIRPFGILGSSFATVISQTLAYGLMWIKMKKINNFHTLKHLPKGIFAVIVMGAASFAMNLLHVQVLINIAVSAFVYLGVLLLLKEKLVQEAKTIFHLDTPVPAQEF